MEIPVRLQPPSGSTAVDTVDFEVVGEKEFIDLSWITEHLVVQTVSGAPVSPTIELETDLFSRYRLSAFGSPGWYRLRLPRTHTPQDLTAEDGPELGLILSPMGDPYGTWRYRDPELIADFLIGRHEPRVRQVSVCEGDDISLVTIAYSEPMQDFAEATAIGPAGESLACESGGVSLPPLYNRLACPLVEVTGIRYIVRPRGRDTGEPLVFPETDDLIISEWTREFVAAGTRCREWMPDFYEMERVKAGYAPGGG